MVNKLPAKVWNKLPKEYTTVIDKLKELVKEEEPKEEELNPDVEVQIGSSRQPTMNGVCQQVAHMRTVSDGTQLLLIMCTGDALNTRT